METTSFGAAAEENELSEHLCMSMKIVVFNLRLA
jgi:hypothetical protein